MMIKPLCYFATYTSIALNLNLTSSTGALLSCEHFVDVKYESCRLAKVGMLDLIRSQCLKEKLLEETVNKFLAETYIDLDSFLIFSGCYHSM